MSDDERPTAAEWAEAFYENREDVLQLLDRVAEERLHNPKSAKQKLKSLISEFKSGEAIFNTLYYSIVEENEKFMSDVKENVDEEVYESVTSVKLEYSRLSNDLEVVYKEHYLQLNNPIMSVNADVDSLSASEAPLIRLAGYSGETKLFESTDYLVNHVRTSAEILKETVRTVDSYKDNYADGDELEELASEPAHIESHVEELRSLINEIDPEALDRADTDDYHE